VITPTDLIPSANETEMAWLTKMKELLAKETLSAGMILHAMKVIRDSVAHVNPGQTPIVVMDQPLFALAKTDSGNSRICMGRTNMLQ